MKKTKKTILITGVNGFMGRALWNYIKKKRHNVNLFGLDINDRYRNKNVFVCNLYDQRKLKSILVSVCPDYIFHFAGGRMKDEKELISSNFFTTKCLLDAVKGIPDFHPRIIIPGSASEYGRMPFKKKLIKEKDEARPRNWYGLVKLMQGSLALVYARNGLDVVIARIFNVLGKDNPPTLAVGNFVQQITMIENGLRKKVIYTKNLDGRRDFLDIEDVCRALFLIAQRGKTGQIYNICSGHAITIRTLLKSLLSYSKVKDILIKESKNGTLSSYDVIGSNAKLKSVAPWSPRVSIERSLKNSLESYRTKMQEL